MIDFNITLHNDNVFLRSIKVSDLDEFWKLTKDTNIWKYTPLDLSIKSELEKWLNVGIDNYNKKIRLLFTIIDKSNNQIIGSSSFGNIFEIDKRIEIG